MIELNLSEWLDELRERLRTDRYAPSPPILCEIPKAKGAIRPGMHLSFHDRVVYFACVGACLPQLHDALGWAQGAADFSYRLAENPVEEHWLRGRVGPWKAFRNESLRLLAEQGYTYVVVADITAYYDLIDIGTLISDLRAIGASREVEMQISQCVNRWASSLGPGPWHPPGQQCVRSPRQALLECS
jgi:hypothetical protein